ncbi:pyrroline-5-carboxylate reductase [Rhodobium orientis]|uniref:Pyrroline-5-carboxylate reductase n=1 Tax=Rhodobium orientis TaxID=34017 RepID=A0A327JS05_9HYPH|nr:pyrroline-5-carboxylate reductase [Rhodobium orientis]MBB4302926.1 pyrroline-5-carboxylate reductase [Rhodobium orientis]MBK5949487.1 pyrroline-5-carboxylate reductase [Rhodobium orientis]RAI29280.1 pyrroline-5-carboxylate reductase [Rhodobium orientis]
MAEKVLLVGCGNMGFAMLQGWLALQPSPQITVVEPAAALRARISDLAVSALASAEDLAADYCPDIVVLAVKPQMFADVLPAYARFAGPSRLFVSIAAGVTTATIAGLTAADAAIVRCMPNTPAAIGHGVMALFANDHVTAGQSEAAATLLAACGTVVRIDNEALMDAVTAVSGSGPAYVFHFIEALSEAARQVGLPEDLADLMAIKTVEGAARLAGSGDDDPATLRQKVTSPGGTTAAALGVLMRDDALSKLVGDAVEAARDRSIELGKSE